MVTAELAVGLPCLVLVLAFALGALAAAGTDLRCQQAAHDGARAAALGQPAGVVRAAAGAQAPAGSTVTVTVLAGTVRVVVAAPVGLPGWWHPLASFRVAGSATAVPAGTR
ncbi:MAG TPA: TadE family type IV pilus minor pilin [Mycobacteriales bacterium]|jgi:hypothetical protein|nr:TadE family type IV pilus minor pilin [Mycobacteriales bacterium]